VRHRELLLRREADAAVAVLGLAGPALLLLLLRLPLAQDLSGVLRVSGQVVVVV
jgi:hypothetical protein